ncbi:hypothetical protein [Neptuniibacter sp. QD37_11]|uniref:hypothetical protein n=1 Tax=Neptuniibacter sp. QD37_11 TaxID=3398209 RepID=UPI0039F4C07F
MASLDFINARLDVLNDLPPNSNNVSGYKQVLEIYPRIKSLQDKGHSLEAIYDWIKCSKETPDGLDIAFGSFKNYMVTAKKHYTEAQ